MMSKNEIRGKTAKERRRNPRIDVELWAVEKRENALHYHLVRNISRDGLYINKPLPFSVGSMVHLDVELSRRIGKVSVTGEIVGNYADSDSNIIGAGVKLIEVGQDEQNRIDRFLAGTSNPRA
jgi:Tfp pilus assembly protein PilZ